MIPLGLNRTLGIAGAVAATLILQAYGLDWYIWVPAGIVAYALTPIAVGIFLRLLLLGWKSIKLVGSFALVCAVTAGAWIKVSLDSSWYSAVGCGVILCIFLPFIIFRVRAIYEVRRLDQMIERVQRGDPARADGLEIGEEAIATIVKNAVAAPDGKLKVATVEEWTIGQVERNRFNTERAVEVYKFAIDDSVWAWVKNMPSGRLMYRAYQRTEQGKQLAIEFVEKFKITGPLAPIGDQRPPRRFLRLLLGA
jgi:hypothetical protein